MKQVKNGEVPQCGTCRRPVHPAGVKLRPAREK